MQMASDSRFVFFLLLGMTAASTGFCQQPAESTPSQRGESHTEGSVEVGVLLNLSGGLSSLGEPARKGFHLAIQNASGASDVFVKTVDTRTDPETTRRAAEEAAATVTVATGFTNNDSLLIAGPIFQKQGKPFLSIGATDPSLPDVIGDCVFLTCFGDNAQAAAAAEFGIEKFGKSAVILWDSSAEYTRTLPKYFRQRYEELGGAVLLDQSYEGCDLKELGEKILELPAKPDFIYLAAMPTCAGQLVSSLRAVGIEAPIMGGDGLDTPTLFNRNEPPLSDLYFTTHAWLSEETGTEPARNFLQAYQSEYGEPPEDAFAALGYDAANLLLDAISRAQDHSPSGLADALESTNGYKGVTGTITFSTSQHVPAKTVWIVAVEQGQRSLAKAFVPKKVPAPLAPEKQ